MTEEFLQEFESLWIDFNDCKKNQENILRLLHLENKSSKPSSQQSQRSKELNPVKIYVNTEEKMKSSILKSPYHLLSGKRNKYFQEVKFENGGILFIFHKRNS